MLGLDFGVVQTESFAVSFVGVVVEDFGSVLYTQTISIGTAGFAFG